MRFGPTSIQLSSVLAKGLRRPKLRADLRISKQIVAGDICIVIKVPETSSYNRYGEFEYELLTLCDGEHTPAEIAAIMSERHPEKTLEETEVLEFLDGMEPGMWERSVGEKNLAILEKIRDERKTRVNSTSLMYLTFKAWDPDKALARLDPYLSWMYTKGFILFSLVLFGIGALIWATDYSRISQDTAAFYNFTDKSASDFVVFWMLLMVLGGIHEMGHGLTCKHFGGEVHQMGFMLIYMTPAFYTDTTDVYMFARAAPRQWTIFAGIWIELVICGVSTIVWYFSLPGSWISDLSYKVLLFSGITGVLLNLNPLIKADGYYALSQHLEMESLREESFAYLWAFLRRYVLRQDIELPPATVRKQRIYLTFSLLATIYSTSLIVISVLFVRNILVNNLGEQWGYVVGLLISILILRGRIQKIWPILRARLRQERERFMAWKMTRMQQVGIAAVVLLLTVPPFSVKVSTDFVLEPGQRAEVRATVPGRVADVRVHEGDSVPAGATLAVLHNPELESRATILEQQLQLAEGDLRAAAMRADSEGVARASHERERLESELTIARTRLGALVLRAPFAGIVTTPQIEQRVGEELPEGADFLTLADRDQMRARILVRDRELEDVHLGATAQVKVSAYPLRTYAGLVEQILPAAAADRPIADPEKVERYGQELTNFFAVVLEFPNSDGSLREGMTGTARISGESYPLAWKAGRAAWRWLRSQVW
jgi:putative peptide zinc metalloprotease protein